MTNFTQHATVPSMSEISKSEVKKLCVTLFSAFVRFSIHVSNNFSIITTGLQVSKSALLYSR